MSDDKKLTLADFAAMFRLGPEKITMTKADAVRLAELAQAAIAEIARLRAAINDALTASFPDPELNSGWQQEPIGPNETPEEAIKRLVSVRAEWAVHKNNCENPVIASLRAELATARREGRKEMAEDVAGWHEARAKEHDAMERKFKAIGPHLAPDTMQSAMRCAEAAIQHRQRALSIRAAAGEGK